MIEDLQTVQSSRVVSQPMRLASTGQRFGNYLLDILFIYIGSFVVGAVFYLIGLGDVIENMNSTLFGVIFLLLYYVPQEALVGWILGKLVTGTRVVKEDGAPIGFGQALGRSLCRFIPFEAFSFLGGNGQPVGWHDSISKTRVISIRKK
jgi:uncharacterized RDD family membrane protein YckC